MKEEEIRPNDIFNEYLRLCALDTKKYFKDAPKEVIACPACNKKGRHAFRKNDFDYELCEDCSTLYVSPRPVSSAFEKYYMEAPSVKYWSTTFYKETAKARREKIWKPKAQMIFDEIRRFGTEDSAIIDIGGGYGIFAEEMQLLIDQPVTVIEPGPHLARVCRDKNIKVIEKFLEKVRREDLPSGSKAFVSFELFEHLYDPGDFLRRLKELMNSGDLFIFTTLSGTGVDIQSLWKDSRSVSPPHHLNFLNPFSVRFLLDRIGLEPLEITTPGKLDIDIMSNDYNQIKDRFWRTFISNASTSEKECWQSFIAERGWSSHMMVCCRKP